MLNKINFISIILGILMICMMINIVSASENILVNEVYDHVNETHIHTLESFNDYIYIGTGSNGTILRSSDGITWNEVYNSLTEAHIQSLKVYNNYIYAGTYPNGLILRSSDGITWTEVYNSPTEAHMLTMELFNDYIYMGTASNGTILRSSEGITWTEVYNSPTELHILSLKVHNGYIYAGTYSNALILRSSDGITWTEIYDHPTQSHIQSLESFDDYIYAGTVLGGLILRSSDGISWNEIYDSSTESYILSLKVHNDYIYAGTYPNGLILRSSDGITWTEVYDSPTEGFIYSLESYNQCIYAGTASNGLILRTSGINLIDNCSLYHKYKTREDYSSDYSGHNNIGTVYNTKSKNGIFNGCAVFNGLDSYIEVVYPQNLSFTNNINDKPFSISFWFNPGYELGQPIVEKGNYALGTAEYTVTIPVDTYKLAVYLNDPGNAYLSCITNDNIDTFDNFNGWLHAYCTYDGSGIPGGLKIYFNGILTNTTNAKIGGVYNCMQKTDESLFIGRQQYVDYEYFNGKLDELKIKDYERQEQDVKHSYNQYINTGYYITLLPKNNFNIQHNISVFRENEFINSIQYGDSIEYNNTYDYTFVIHEDITDQIAHIENINDIAENNISYIVYILIIFMIIGLIIYFVRR